MADFSYADFLSFVPASTSSPLRTLTSDVSTPDNSVDTSYLPLRDSDFEAESCIISIEKCMVGVLPEPDDGSFEELNDSYLPDNDMEHPDNDTGRLGSSLDNDVEQSDSCTGRLESNTTPPDNCTERLDDSKLPHSHMERPDYEVGRLYNRKERSDNDIELPNNHTGLLDNDVERLNKHTERPESDVGRQDNDTGRQDNGFGRLNICAGSCAAGDDVALPHGVEFRVESTPTVKQGLSLSLVSGTARSEHRRFRKQKNSKKVTNSSGCSRVEPVSLPTAFISNNASFSGFTIPKLSKLKIVLVRHPDCATTIAARPNKSSEHDVPSAEGLSQTRVISDLPSPPQTGPPTTNITPAHTSNISTVSTFGFTPAHASNVSTISTFNNTPIHATTNTLVSGTDITSIPATASTKVSGTDITSIPATASTTVPGTDITSLLSTDSITVPAINITSIPATASTTVPGTDITSIPATASITVPGTSITSLPATTSTTVPAATSTWLPITATEHTTPVATDSADTVVPVSRRRTSIRWTPAPSVKPCKRSRRRLCYSSSSSSDSDLSDHIRRLHDKYASSSPTDSDDEQAGTSAAAAAPLQLPPVRADDSQRCSASVADIGRHSSPAPDDLSTDDQRPETTCGLIDLDLDLMSDFSDASYDREEKLQDDLQSLKSCEDLGVPDISRQCQVLAKAASSPAVSLSGSSRMSVSAARYSRADSARLPSPITASVNRRSYSDRGSLVNRGRSPFILHRGGSVNHSGTLRLDGPLRRGRPLLRSGLFKYYEPLSRGGPLHRGGILHHGGSINHGGSLHHHDPPDCDSSDDDELPCAGVLDGYPSLCALSAAVPCESCTRCDDFCTGIPDVRIQMGDACSIVLSALRAAILSGRILQCLTFMQIFLYRTASLMSFDTRVRILYTVTDTLLACNCANDTLLLADQLFRYSIRDSLLYANIVRELEGCSIVDKRRLVRFVAVISRLDICLETSYIYQLLEICRSVGATTASWRLIDKMLKLKLSVSVNTVDRMVRSALRRVSTLRRTLELGTSAGCTVLLASSESLRYTYLSRARAVGDVSLLERALRLLLQPAGGRTQAAPTAAVATCSRETPPLAPPVTHDQELCSSHLEQLHGIRLRVRRATPVLLQRTPPQLLPALSLQLSAVPTLPVIGGAADHTEMDLLSLYEGLQCAGRPDVAQYMQLCHDGASSDWSALYHLGANILMDLVRLQDWKEALQVARALQHRGFNVTVPVQVVSSLPFSQLELKVTYVDVFVRAGHIFEALRVIRGSDELCRVFPFCERYLNLLATSGPEKAASELISQLLEDEPRQQLMLGDQLYVTLVDISAAVNRTLTSLLMAQCDSLARQLQDAVERRHNDLGQLQLLAESVRGLLVVRLRCGHHNRVRQLYQHGVHRRIYPKQTVSVDLDTATASVRLPCWLTVKEMLVVLEEFARALVAAELARRPRRCVPPTMAVWLSEQRQSVELPSLRVSFSLESVVQRLTSACAMMKPPLQVRPGFSTLLYLVTVQSLLQRF